MRRALVTGIGMISPLGPDRETTWQAVKEGRSAAGVLHDIDLTGQKTRIGAQVDRAWLAAADRDPFIRFALHAAEEAVRNAGLPLAEMDRSRVGCFVGSSKGGVITVHEEQARMLRGEPPTNRLLFDFLPNMASVAVWQRHGLAGPCGNIVAACATGALCIAHAAELIEAGTCDAVLAGASDASITPAILAGFDKMRLLARGNGDPGTAARPFDRDREGFILGEGACVLAVEAEEHARRRGAASYGAITGWSSSSQAYAMTHHDPSGAGIAAALRTALRRGVIAPEDIGYINAHGTGTRQNDAVETKAIRTAFGEAADRIPVSSTKPLTGHLLGAAGSIEFAIALLAMRDGFLPPTINLDHPDPECDLDCVPKTGRPATIRNGLSISSGLGGQVCVLVASGGNTQ
ncbi:MAG: beta-ketoacyl-[acyl-carrier-protein] synthase family protein [Planctomycetes bacterium]|nr:beta-ketoacyl-[acyl-carrier-protein] synthase family protein [Planctomycetota bacterium]